MAVINWGFFEGWSPELAWWLGVLYGDGNVYAKRGTYRVSMVGNRATAERWLALFAPEKTPKRIRKGVRAVQAYADSKQLVELVEERFGICGPKTHDLRWPLELPRELEPHFFRGLWDADGHVSLSKRGKGQGNDYPLAMYSSACRTFLQTMRVRLMRWTGVSRAAIVEQCKGRSFWYSVKWTGSKAILVLDYLYLEAPEHIRNETKYQVYREAREHYLDVQMALCACGRPVTREDQCQACWWKGRRKTGKGTLCEECNEKPVLAKGLCSACYTRKRRACA